jgi:hypothetical protein
MARRRRKRGRRKMTESKLSKILKTLPKTTPSEEEYERALFLCKEITKVIESGHFDWAWEDIIELQGLVLKHQYRFNGMQGDFIRKLEAEVVHCDEKEKERGNVERNEQQP